MTRRTLLRWPFVVLAVGCRNAAEPALPLVVIDTEAGWVVEEWKAPHLAYDIAIDDATGRAWLMAEHGGTYVWEVFPDREPQARAELPPSAQVSPPWPPTREGSLDRNQMALDPVRRRGAFSSSRSDVVLFLDLDSAEEVFRLHTYIFPHSIAYDIPRGVGYLAWYGVFSKFDTETGGLLIEELCPQTLAERNVVVSSATGMAFTGSIGDDLCLYDAVANTSSIFTIDCGGQIDFYGHRVCETVGLALSPAEDRLYVAFSRDLGADPLPDDPPPGLVFVDLTTKEQQYVVDTTGPNGIEVSPDGTTLYVSTIGCQRIRVYDAATRQPRYDIPLDGEPRGMDLSEDGTRLYVTLADPDGRLGGGTEWVETRWGPCPPLVPK